MERQAITTAAQARQLGRRHIPRLLRTRQPPAQQGMVLQAPPTLRRLPAMGRHIPPLHSRMASTAAQATGKQLLHLPAHTQVQLSLMCSLSYIDQLVLSHRIVIVSSITSSCARFV